MSKRSDSDYWRDAVRPENIPDHLQELLSLWRYRPPYYNDFVQIQEVFPSASYQYVLYGMEFQTHIPEYARQSDDVKSGFGNIELTQQKIKKYMSGLPSNRELIEHIKKHGLHRI